MSAAVRSITGLQQDVLLLAWLVLLQRQFGVINANYLRRINETAWLLFDPTARVLLLLVFTGSGDTFGWRGRTAGKTTRREKMADCAGKLKSGEVTRYELYVFTFIVYTGFALLSTA